MLNVTNKLALFVAISAICVSCSDSNPEKKAAQETLARAEQAMSAGDFSLALSLMDSLNINYPDQIDVRRKALALRPKAIEQATIVRIAQADSMIAVSQLEIERLTPLMRHVSGDDLEGYYVVADAFNPSFSNSTGIEPRVNDKDFNFYIVSNIIGKSIGTNQVALVTPNEECRGLQMPQSSERTMVIEGSESASFIPEEVDSLGAWASKNKENIKGAMIYGKKGQQKVQFKPIQAAAFGTAWEFSNQKRINRAALILREKLERQLQISRDQSANIAQEDEE